MWVTIFTSILLIILLVLPYLVGVDGYRPKVLAAINKEFPGKLTVEKAQLRFLPRPGLTLTQIRLEAAQGEAQPMLLIPKADLVLDIKSLLKKERRVSLIASESALTVECKDSGECNLRTLLQALSTRKSAPAQTDSKERASFFENFRVKEVRLEKANVSIATPGWRSNPEVRDFHATFGKKEWKVAFLLDRCAPSEEIHLAISEPKISVLGSTRNGSLAAWNGSILWNGEAQLTHGKQRWTAPLSQVSCTP
jgi:hypothetical protein